MRPRGRKFRLRRGGLSFWGPRHGCESPRDVAANIDYLESIQEKPAAPAGELQ